MNQLQHSFPLRCPEHRAFVPSALTSARLYMVFYMRRLSFEFENRCGSVIHFDCAVISLQHFTAPDNQRDNGRDCVCSKVCAHLSVLHKAEGKQWTLVSHFAWPRSLLFMLSCRTRTNLGSRIIPTQFCRHGNV